MCYNHILRNIEGMTEVGKNIQFYLLSYLSTPMKNVTGGETTGIKMEHQE